MMKLICTIIVCLIAVSMHAEPKVIFYQEYGSRGYTLYADNEEPMPVYVQIEFKMRNLRLPQRVKDVFVIPPNAVKHRVTDLVVINPLEDYSFTYDAKVSFGNPTKKDYDVIYAYNLPFRTGGTYMVKQGYGGSRSHVNQYALDFEMPEGSEVFAARRGIVVEVVDKHNVSCESDRCDETRNYILVYHSDGTLAEYAHFKKDGVVVKKDDEVMVGQLLGYIGPVSGLAYSMLHFEVYLPQPYGKKTLKTNFRQGMQGEDSSLLNDNQMYTRHY